MIPIQTVLPTPDGRNVACWKGLEIHKVTLASGPSTRRGGVFRETFEIWARGDEYSQGYWVIPYWGSLVPAEVCERKQQKSVSAYYVSGEYGCLDGRPCLWPGPYLSNLGPLLDEAVEGAGPPIFYIVCLSDLQLAKVDEKAERTPGWDSSHCPLGNRFVLCSRRGAIKREVLWTTLYGWSDRKDCTWRPYRNKSNKGHAASRMIDVAKAKTDKKKALKARANHLNLKGSAAPALSTKKSKARAASIAMVANHDSSCQEAEAVSVEPCFSPLDLSEDEGEEQSEEPSEENEFDGYAAFARLSDLNWDRVERRFNKLGMPCLPDGRVTFKTAELIGQMLGMKYREKGSIFNTSSETILAELNQRESVVQRQALLEENVITGELRLYESDKESDAEWDRQHAL